MGELSLLLGDLNASPYTLEYQLVTLFSDLKDCHNMNDGDGFTSAARDNVYSNSAEYPERIDYVFYKVGVKPKIIESQVWYRLLNLPPILCFNKFFCLKYSIPGQ